MCNLFFKNKDFRSNSIPYLLTCTEKNIIGARLYKIRAQDKVTAAIRSAAAPE